MAVEVFSPGKKQESSIGRRLFAMGAPMVGGALGGPVGAAIGGMVGSKVGGASTQDAVMGGVQAGIAQKAAPAASAPAAGLNQSQKLSMPALGDSAFSRRMSASSQNPKIAIHEGLEALKAMPPEIQDQYAPDLIKAQMALERPQLGASYARRR